MDILSSCTFELEDIEIIHHKSENEEKFGTFNCDQCSLFFLEKDKLAEHKKKHGKEEIVKCKYCNKKISSTSESRECYVNKKCETCEYKCSKCPQRFLRHSSLINHERKHSSPKRKRTLKSDKKINGISAENTADIAVPTGLKRKRIKTDISGEKLKEVKIRKSSKNCPLKNANIDGNAQATADVENTRSKMTKRTSSKIIEKDNFETVKTSKRPTLKSNKLLEEKSSDNKSKQDIISGNSQTVSPHSNLSNNENVVNYKPFSCHVCGDTFASDSALLDHIKTHGENAAKSFKCKFCSDEFDDVYKMQYHLAICPLAEDELESSLKQVIPLTIPLKYSGSITSPRKRGRPKRVQDSPLDHKINDDESTPTSKRGNRKQRKSEVKVSNEILQISSGPSLPKKPKILQHNKLISGANNNLPHESKKDDLVSGEVTEVKEVKEPVDDRKKLHQCPFPRCDFKFTREKALLCHMRNHSDDFDDSLKCHKCDIPFDDIHTLRQHINTCKGIKEERDDDFSRAGCFDPSPNRSSIKLKKDYLCMQCGRSYQNQEKLDRHLESCGSKFVCRICKDDFLNQLLLDEHYASKHPPYTAYHCYICEEDFISELFLKIHQSDEHRSNKNTQSIGDSVRKSSPILPTRRSVETYDKDNDNAMFPMKKASSTLNLPLTRHTNKICTGSVTIKTGKCVSNTQLYWCPVCLVGFDSKHNMRVHFRENHVLENNSNFTCEICEVKMPFAEMMIYHLELHSTNLLSVNRFSKLVPYVKKNRGSEFRRSGMEIKREEVYEDKTGSPIKVTIDSHAVENNPTRMVRTRNKTIERKSDSVQDIKLKPRNSLGGEQNSPVIESELTKKHELNLKSKMKRKSTPINNPSNDESELKTRKQNEINSEKSTRLLRSRGIVNIYPLQDQDKTSFRQKVKLEKVSDEETCLESTPLNDTITEMEYSVALKKTELAKKPGQINKKVRRRKSRHVRKKKQTNTVESIHSDELINCELLSNTENKEDLKISNIHNQLIDKTKINSIESTQLHSKIIENSRDKIESESKDKPLTNAASIYIENSATVSISCNDPKDFISDFSIEKNVNRNPGFNFLSKERCGKLITQNSEQNNPKMMKESLAETTEESDELKTTNNILLETSVDFSGSESSETANGELVSENSPTSMKEPVLEESTTSTVGGCEGICCTMCTETFYNQDELLDHLSSHI